MSTIKIIYVIALAFFLGACAPNEMKVSSNGGGSSYVNGCAAAGGADGNCVVHADASRGESLIDVGGTTAGGHPRPPVLDTPDPTNSKPPPSVSSAAPAPVPAPAPAPDQTVPNETTAGGNPAPPPISK